MSNNKIIQALGSAAGSAGGATLNVEDVFSTYLYTGTGSRIRIQNGVNVLNEGGLIWIKDRTTTQNHYMIDTARGVYGVDGVTDSKYLSSNTNTVETSSGSSDSQVGHSNAYPTPAIPEDGFYINNAAIVNNNDYASWTFRKAPKFFDVVTYTGNGTSGRTVSHNLGSAPGCIIIKGTSSNYEWSVYHRGMDSTAPEDYFMWLNHTYGRFDNTGYWNDTAPTSTQFTLGNNGNVNSSGQTYVAYLFAHNDGDGEFGPDADADIIKCGSYTGNGSSQHIDLGFEPQWILHRRSNDTAPWRIYDVMRGIPVGSDDAILEPNASSAEFTYNEAFQPTPTGFTVPYSAPYYNATGVTYIYIAIRRGPMAVPESADEVFDVKTSSSSSALLTSDTVTTDALLHSKRSTSAAFRMHSRLTGQNGLTTYSTAAESDYSTWLQTDEQTGFELTGFWTTNPAVYYSWKRAPNFFDVVAYTGDGAATQDINHNLGVAPEMIWVKNRDSGATQWPTWHVGNPNYTTYLNHDFGSFQTGGLPYYVGQSVTDTTFRVSTDGSAGQSNASGNNYIAYLFASLDGVSKVGSYTGNGTSQTIDCGFSSGARFVLIKQTDTNGTNWFVFDSERGIVSGNDNALRLNTTDAEVTNEDAIDPVSSGFSVTNSGGFIDTNNSGGTYIFYAIA